MCPDPREAQKWESEPEADPYQGVPEVAIDPDHVDDEAGEHLPAGMIPEGDE